MPVLAQMARPDLRATGYGIFNFAGSLSAGLFVLATGFSKSTIGIGGMLEIASVLLFESAILLIRLRLKLGPLASE
jgi:hypothetical protein